MERSVSRCLSGQGICSALTLNMSAWGRRTCLCSSNRWLVDSVYPEARVIRLVMDKLNTHTATSLYEAFPPEEAQRNGPRLEVHYTPKHGSWLTMAEIEISIFERGCLSKRVKSFDHLWQHIVILATERNAGHCRIHWRFTCADARAQMHDLYPSPKIKAVYRLTLVHGRHSTPVEVLLRMLILKHLYQWSYRATKGRVKDSLVLRWFCRARFHELPDASTLWRWEQTLRPETVHALVDRVAQLAKQARVTKGGKLRLDATCVQTTIHHPTDSGLLVDSVRVLSRLV